MAFRAFGTVYKNKAYQGILFVTWRKICAVLCILFRKGVCRGLGNGECRAVCVGVCRTVYVWV